MGPLHSVKDKKGELDIQVVAPRKYAEELTGYLNDYDGRVKKLEFLLEEEAQIRAEEEFRAGIYLHLTVILAKKLGFTTPDTLLQNDI